MDHSPLLWRCPPVCCGVVASCTVSTIPSLWSNHATQSLWMASGEHLFCRDGQILDAHPHGVIDGVGNGWGHRGNGVFTDGFPLKGALASWGRHEYRDQGGDVLHRGDLRLTQTERGDAPLFRLQP